MRYLYKGLYTIAILCFVSALYPVAILVFGEVGMGADVVAFMAINLVMIGAVLCVLAEFLMRWFCGQVRSKGRLVLFSGILASPVVVMIGFLIVS